MLVPFGSALSQTGPQCNILLRIWTLLPSAAAAAEGFQRSGERCVELPHWGL